MMGKTVKALIGVIEEAAIHIWQRTADRRIMCARLVANVVATARPLPARRRHAAIDRDRAQSSPAEALVVLEAVCVESTKPRRDLSAKPVTLICCRSSSMPPTIAGTPP